MCNSETVIIGFFFWRVWQYAHVSNSCQQCSPLKFRLKKIVVPYSSSSTSLLKSHSFIGWKRHLYVCIYIYMCACMYNVSSVLVSSAMARTKRYEKFAPWGMNKFSRLLTNRNWNRISIFYHNMTQSCVQAKILFKMSTVDLKKVFFHTLAV